MSDSEYLFNVVVVGIHVMKCTPTVRGFGVLTDAEGHREPTQHGVLQCQAGGEGAVPPAMSYCTACPSKELLRCELLAIPAAIYSMLVYNEM
jgi:hypothetical protein